jgi:hypothetical protein
MSYERAIALMSRGVSKPTLYDVQLPVASDRGVNSFTNNYIGLYCVAVDLPETRVNTITANGHEHIGIVRDQPTQMLYGKPLTLTIIADKDYNSYKAIRSWLDVTTPFGANQEGAFRTQRMSFQTNMVAPITLTKLELPANQKITPDRDNANYTNLYKKVLRFEFINAFPMSLGAVSLGSDRTDSYATFDATFMFESYRLDTDLRNENGVG